MRYLKLGLVWLESWSTFVGFYNPCKYLAGPGVEQLTLHQVHIGGRATYLSYLWSSICSPFVFPAFVTVTPPKKSPAPFNSRGKDMAAAPPAALIVRNITFH